MAGWDEGLPSPCWQVEKEKNPSVFSHFPRKDCLPDFSSQRRSSTGEVSLYRSHVACVFNHIQNTHRAHPAVPTWQFALVVDFHKEASSSKDSHVHFRFFFPEVLFFVILFLGELSPPGGRVVGRSFRVVLLSPPLLLGGSAFLHLLWVVVLSFLGKQHHPERM